MKRRSLILGGLGTAMGGAWLARPEDMSDGGHSGYFQSLSGSLHVAKLARPTMLVDLDRVDHNIDELRKYVNGDKAYRIVAKSLPSQGLIEYVMDRAKTGRLMVFHQPFANELAQRRPDCDLLFGKPMPVAAAERFYRHLKGSFNPARQLQWLIDTPARLAQYAALAETLDISMTLNIEIDVGLHRGGLQRPDELGTILDAIAADPRLTFGGLMGYDPQVAKAPTLLGLRDREGMKAQSLYADFLAVFRAHTLGQQPSGKEVFNAAGSPTFRRWKNDSSANELAAGSGLLMPTDFDIPSLDTHQPALFIATPVLKKSSGVDIPVVSVAGSVQQLWDPNRAKSFFVYGGYWKAKPVSPAGLSKNPIYGNSSNQEMLNAGNKVDLEVDDYVFYRPTQSEFVMLQFGDIIAVRGGRIEKSWPVIPQSA